MQRKPPEPVLGIKIEYENTGNELWAHFFIGTGVSSKTFVTNNEIREMIRESGFETDTKLGHMCIMFQRPAVGLWTEYFPFLGASARYFSRKGLAQLLEYRILEELNKRHPDVSLIKYGTKRGSRYIQLTRRGLGPLQIAQGVKYETAMGMLRQKIAKDTFRGRKRRSHRL